MTATANDTVIRTVTPADAQLLHTLAVACPPLSVHTPYTYWVQAFYFHEQCFVAERGDEPIGFLTSITGGGRVLLWQIGVLSEHRHQEVAQRLIAAVAGWARQRGYDAIDVSIDPANQASRRAFWHFAQRTGGALEPIGALDLRDPADPSFRETEELLALRFGAVPPVMSDD